MQKKRRKISQQIMEDGRFNGLFPGWGNTRVIGCYHSFDKGNQTILDTDKMHKYEGKWHPFERHRLGLNTLFSLSIGGNDLLSSSLYTAGICATYGGKLAPISLCLVTLMLFFFRNILAEVITAIPVNGGNYNALLNVSTKKSAAFVSCLSILSYTATAIISAFAAIVYLSILWPTLDIRIGTVITLAAFAVITSCGAGESAAVSVVMFVMHTSVLVLIIIWCFAYGCQNEFSFFYNNLRHTEYPSITSSDGDFISNGNVISAIFFGYAAGMLGITGVETPANYVEEMKDSKVLLSVINWMWVLVGTINPLLSLVAMMVMPLDEIYDHQSDLLAHMGDIVGGKVFKLVIVIDAVVVLMGGVLTAYVGVSSLLKTLAVDSILPSFLSWTNRRNAAYVSIIVFCCISISLFTFIFTPEDPKNIGGFGGVFAIAFLSVLISFLFANILIKLNRQHLPRLVIAKWWEVWFCSLTIGAGLLGNLILSPSIFVLFLIYLAAAVFIVSLMFMRVSIYSYLIWMLRNMSLDFDGLKKQSLENKKIRRHAREQEEYVENDSLDALMGEANEFVHQISTDNSVSVQLRKVISSGEHGVAIRRVLSGHVPESASSGGVEMQNRSSAALHASGSSEEGMKVRRIFSDVGQVSSSISSRLSLRVTESIKEGEDAMLGVDGVADENAQTSRLEQEEADEEDVNPNNLFAGLGSVLSRLNPIAAGDDDDARAVEIANSRRARSTSLFQLDGVENKYLFKTLLFCMESLEQIIATPVVFLCKSLDPPVLNAAMEYISSNELTNSIMVVHIVDDRKLIKTQQQIVDRMLEFTTMNEEQLLAYKIRLLNQTFLSKKSTQSNHPSIVVRNPSNHGNQHDDNELSTLLQNVSSEAQMLTQVVSLFDTLYTSKRVSCLIVRGSYFCPSTINWLSEYIGVPPTNMIMGAPGEKFEFPISQLCGVRIALHESDVDLRKSASSRLDEVLKASSRVSNRVI